MTDRDRLAAALAGRYTLERELGQGGMATVYLAQDLKHDRQVAIKVLREDLTASLGGGRFLREIKFAAQLQHPNILPLLDSGEADGFLFYVMPYVAGQSLRERLAREGELPVHEAVRLITEVVDALAHAHSHGVVHRDIKPDNVMLSGRHALVTDFGVAKALAEGQRPEAATKPKDPTLTARGVSVGTPTYMSPEQAAADPHIDHRSDIYAVGVLAYELLTGQPPFVGATPQSVLAAHVTQAPDPITNRRPGIAAPLNAVIMRCLAKRPADRYQSAAELLAALEPFGTPSSGITPTQTRPTAAGARRSRWWIAGAAAVLLLAAIGYWRFGRGSATATAAQAIAVLPFDNVTHDTAYDYLADGIASDVRSALMGKPGLIVKARTSSEAARGKPVHDAGAMLNVPVILQGTYHHAVDQTTVTVELVKVADEAALWSGNFTLPANGNFSTAQDSITAAVAKALHLGASSAGGSAEARRGTSDQDAYDLYLKGQFFFAKRGVPSMRRAMGYYQQAIARDSNFARAYAGLALLLTVLPSYTQIKTDSVFVEAERLARRALTIDPALADGHLALADVLTGEARPAAAEPEYLAGLAADPRNALAHQWHGDNLMYLGRVDDAIRESEAAADLDPLSAVADNDLAYNLICAGRFAEAVRITQRALEIDSSFDYSREYRGIAFVFSGQPDSAGATFEHLFQADSMEPFVRAYHVWRFALMGRWSDAQRELATIERTVIGGSRDVDLAIANMALGNNGVALDALERAARAHSFYAATEAVGCDPTFSALRTEPRFGAVLKQLGQGLCTGTTQWPFPARARP